MDLPAGAVLLRSVDRAAFVVALGERLRRAGVPVTFTALGAFTEALGVSPPRDVESLYWLARVTLVDRVGLIPPFDAVFAAVFRDAVLPVEGQAGAPEPPPGADELLVSLDARPAPDGAADDLPWHLLPRVTTSDESSASDDGRGVPDLLPSDLVGLADTPFEQLDEEQLARIGAWLEASWRHWPMRRSRRRRVLHSSGGAVALRETIAASRRTGWEPVRLSRTQPVRRPRPLTMVVDVSQSMQPYATAYLHLMRALSSTGRAEAFAFSTSLTRITPALRHRSAATAMEQATAQVGDRYGGTHLATSLRSLLTSRHGNFLRGGVLVVASDGWDSDDPERLAAVLTRMRLRAHRVVWLNPRAASPGFEPLVGSMAAALPFCDAFLPAHTASAMREAVDAILS